jgi:adenylate cyclase
MHAGGRIVAVRSLDATVLFADLVNYTEMSSSLPGEQVLELLREFHRLVEDAVFGNEGTLDKYMGDGLMATFGTPRPGLRDATNAVACARHLISAVNRWNERRALAALPKIQISVGLHFGEVTLGDVGSDRRFEFTAVGHTVNLASRIEAASRALQTEIVASDAVIAAVRREGGDAILAGFENLGSHPVRGSRIPIGLWGLTNGA